MKAKYGFNALRDKGFYSRYNILYPHMYPTLGGWAANVSFIQRSAHYLRSFLVEVMQGRTTLGGRVRPSFVWPGDELNKRRSYKSFFGSMKDRG